MGSTEKKSPNIVFLMTDQQKASAASYLGNSLVPSPFMDHMASTSYSFSNAYVASPICTPSRTSIHTGVYPHVHQVFCHQNRAPHNLRFLSEILQDNGYFTAVCGHYEEKRNLGRGYHESASFQEYGKLANSLKAEYANARSDVSWSSGSTGVPADECNSSLVADRSILMVDAAKSTNQPFFLHVCINDPHPPYFVPPPYDEIVDPSCIPLPRRGKSDDIPQWHHACLKDNGTDAATDKDIQKTIATYYGMIAYADAQMKRIYDALAERSMLEDTWFIIASDHGDYTGEKGLFCKSESLYECLLHVPLLIRPPENMRITESTRIDHLVNLVDLFPTILGIANIAPPSYTQGIDLMPWIDSGATDPIHDFMFAQVGEYHGFIGTSWPGGMPKSGRHPSLLQGGRTLTHSYTQDPDYGDEAYNLTEDPLELRNLLNHGAALPEPVTAIKEATVRFENACIALRNELGVVPGYRGFDEGWE